MPCGVAQLAADADVVEHREFAEQPDVLERAREAGAGDLVRLAAVDAVAVDGDRAGLRAIDAGEEIEDGGLARAVGADESVQAGGGASREILDRLRPPKAMETSRTSRSGGASIAVGLRYASMSLPVVARRGGR